MKSFFVFLLLIIPFSVNAACANSGVRKVKTKTNIQDTEIGYKSSERVALKKQLVQIEASNTSPKSSSCK